MYSIGTLKLPDGSGSRQAQTLGLLDHYLQLVGELPPVSPDFGIKHQLTLSDGLRFNYEVPLSERVKRLQRRLSRQKKGSRNYEYTRHLLRRGDEKLNNRKRDIQNKLLAFLSRYPTVVLQDDQVKGCCGWKVDRDHNAALVILRRGLGLIPGHASAYLVQALGLDRPEGAPLGRPRRGYVRMGAALQTVGSNPYVRIGSVVEGGSAPKGLRSSPPL